MKIHLASGILLLFSVLEPAISRPMFFKQKRIILPIKTKEHYFSGNIQKHRNPHGTVYRRWYHPAYKRLHETKLDNSIQHLDNRHFKRNGHRDFSGILKLIHAKELNRVIEKSTTTRAAISPVNKMIITTSETPTLSLTIRSYENENQTYKGNDQNISNIKDSNSENSTIRKGVFDAEFDQFITEAENEMNKFEQELKHTEEEIENKFDDSETIDPIIDEYSDSTFNDIEIHGAPFIETSAHPFIQTTTNIETTLAVHGDSYITDIKGQSTDASIVTKSAEKLSNRLSDTSDNTTTNEEFINVENRSKSGVKLKRESVQQLVNLYGLRISPMFHNLYLVFPNIIRRTATNTPDVVLLDNEDKQTQKSTELSINNINRTDKSKDETKKAPTTENLVAQIINTNSIPNSANFAFFKPITLAEEKMELSNNGTQTNEISLALNQELKHETIRETSDVNSNFVPFNLNETKDRRDERMKDIIRIDIEIPAFVLKRIQRLNKRKRSKNSMNEGQGLKAKFYIRRSNEDSEGNHINSSTIHPDVSSTNMPKRHMVKRKYRINRQAYPKFKHPKLKYYLNN